MSSRPPPSGFELVGLTEGFLHTSGPLYARAVQPGEYTAGFWVEEKHCNMSGVCHGGCLASFVDLQLGGIAYRHRRTKDGGIATISLSTDFLAPAPLGAWVEGNGEAVKVTRKLVFVQMIARADGEPCLRASGVFKI